MSIDSSPEKMKKAIALFDGDARALAENYYSNFVSYIKDRKADIIGHFDLLLKFDKKGGFGLYEDPEYHKIAEKYIKEALKVDCFFEVNTGAISGGWRTAPYPSEKLLRVIKKEGGKLVLNSDCHNADCIDYYFSESRKLLRDLGFTHLYTLSRGEWVKDYL